MEIKKSLDKQNWKHNIPKPMNVEKTVLREKFISANAYIKEKGRYQITQLYSLRQQKKKYKMSPNIA